MARRTIGVAIWEYLDTSKPPKRRIAYFGDEVDLSAAEIRRAKSAGVFDQAGIPDGQVVTGLDAGTAIVDDAADLAVADGDATDDLEGLATDAANTAPEDVVVIDPADGDVVEPAKGSLPKPSNTAGLPVWVAYAVDQGLDEDEAKAMDRAALIKALA